MGVVYQAWQPQLARRVAIKVVSASVGIGAEDRRRWLREAQAIGRVRHRNVVQLHEAGEQDGCLYLVLDLIAGGSLADRVTGPLPARVAVELMATVARAVDQIHQRRDVASRHQALEHLARRSARRSLGSGHADARRLRHRPGGRRPGATATGPIGVRGTPSFMAPEQIAGDRAAIGPRSDVFALGATLYSLLTGRPPFQAASVIETLDLVRTREPAPPRTLVPGLPRDLETIALTCLRKDPRRRYASAGALADDLQRWLDGFPIRARPVSKLEHVSRWCRRRPAFASLLAVLALTVASSLVGLLTLWRHSEAERAAGRECPGPCHRERQGHVRQRFAISSACWRRPWMHRKCSRLNDSKSLRVSYAISRRNCVGIRVFAASNLVAICDLERQLAEDFRRRGKYAESRALLMDSLDLLGRAKSWRRRPGCRRGVCAGPDGTRVGSPRVRSASTRRWPVSSAPRRYWKAWSTTRDTWRSSSSIDGSRRAIAAMFGRRGLEEPRRRLLESHIRMLERLSEHAGGDPAIGLLAALARLELAPDDSASAKLRAAIQRFPADGRLPQLLQERVADWIASDVKPYPSGPNPPANRRAASTRMPTPMRSSGRSNQDARRSALTTPCFPPRPSRWPALPPVGPRSNERRAAWTMPARPPHVSLPSPRRWHEEIPTRRRFTWCCA